MNRFKQAVALAAMAGTFVAAAASADDKATPAPAPRADMNAMRVVVDPDSGEVRAPTEEELRALIEAEKAASVAMRTARSAKPEAPQVMPAEKTVTRHKNGMISMRMSQDSLSAIAVQSAADGKAQLVHQDESTTQAKAEEK